MKFRPIIVDNKLKELTEHGTQEFPVSMDEQIVSNENCHEVLHWHYEVQIARVTKGQVIFRTPDGEFLINEGECIFINSGCLHEAVTTGDKNSIYECVNFNPSVIYGQNSSVVRRDYVDPVLFSPEMQVIPLAGKGWETQIKELFDLLAKIYESHGFGYELSIQIILCQMWLLIVENNRTQMEANSSITFAEKERMNILKRYIHQNYAEKIALCDIANAAHISEGECCRIFRRIQHTTPFLYLIGFRISQSIKLLSSTDYSVTEIA
ncbi:MAG: AraC family transcriptional regulator, partial [Lachnospiraceae bacterium]|nr:AraC family transcriptional regulator [Lachnospiraceae bacterium]